MLKNMYRHSYRNIFRSNQILYPMNSHFMQTHRKIVNNSNFYFACSLMQDYQKLKQSQHTKQKQIYHLQTNAFLTNLMTKRVHKDTLFQIANDVLDIFQTERSKLIQNSSINYKQQDFYGQTQIDESVSKNKQNQNKECCPQVDIIGSQKTRQCQSLVCFENVKFISYCYNIYPTKVNVSIIDVMVNNYFKDIKYAASSQQLSGINNGKNVNSPVFILKQFQGHLKFMLQSQFFKGNYKFIKHSLNSYIQFLIKCSSSLVSQLNQLDRIESDNNQQSAKTSQNFDISQKQQKLRQLSIWFRYILYSYPILKVEVGKQSKQQDELVSILNSPYQLILNNFYVLIASINKRYIKQYNNRQDHNMDLSLIRHIKEDFVQYKQIYKHLRDILVLIVEHEEQKKQRTKTDKQIDISAIFGIDNDLMLCKNQLQFRKVLYLLQNLINFNFQRKINIKNVNNFYKNLFKINSKHIGKNQLTKRAIWKHLSMHSMNLNYQIINFLDKKQINLL